MIEDSDYSSRPAGRFDNADEADPLAIHRQPATDEVTAAVAYDEDLRDSGPAPETATELEAIDPNLAKTMRLLRDVLGSGPAGRSLVAEPIAPVAKKNGRQIDLDRSVSAATSSNPPAERQIAGLPSRFQIQHELGRGSFGIVYQAHDDQLKRDVAVKVMRPELLADQPLKERFLQESRAAARLNHPSIVRVYQADHSDQLAWQVSELITGAPLSKHLTGQPLPERLAARFIRDLSDAVQHAHSASVLHRDIKPENILLDRVPGESLESATPRLADFGLARLMDVNMQISRSGLLVGTPRYMAPEQLCGDGSQHGPATDVYSLGVLLYKMLAGRGPFQHVTSLPQRMASAHMPVKSISHVRVDVSRDLATICQKCLEPAPSDRYQTAGDLRDDLQRFLDGRATIARPLPIHERCSRWSYQHPAAAAFLLTVTLATVVILTTVLKANQTVRERNIRLVAEQERSRSLTRTTESLRIVAENQQAQFQLLAWKAGIRDAYAAWEHRQFADADAALDRLTRQDLSAESHPEWQMLRQEIDHDFKRLLTLPVSIHEIRLVPNSTLIAAAAADGVLYLVDYQSDQVVRTIATNVPSLHALAISRDGTMVATGGSTDTVSDLSVPLVYDIQTGNLLHRLAGQSTTIESLEFSADGKWLAVGPRYENVQLIRLTDRQRHELSASRRHLWLSSSSDGRSFAAQVSGESLLVANSQPPFQQDVIQLPARILLSTWLPNSSLLLHALHGSLTLQLYDVAKRSVICEFVDGVQAVESIGTSSDGTLAAAGLINGEVTCWAVPKQFRSSSGNSVPPGPGPFDDGNTDAIAATVPRAAPATPVQSHARWQLFSSPVTSIAISDGWLLASSFEGQLVAIRRPQVREPVPTQRTPQHDFSKRTTAVAWSSDGRSFLKGHHDGSVIRLDDETESPVASFSTRTIEKDFAGSTELQPAEHGPSSYTSLNLWDAGEVTALAISPDTNSAVWAHRFHGTLFLSHLGVNRLLWAARNSQESTPSTVQTAEFSPDGKHLAWTGSDATLHVLDLTATEANISSHDLPGHGGCLAWTPDGRTVFCGGQFTSIQQLDVTTNQLNMITDYGIHTHAIVSSKDAQLVVSGHQGGIVRFLNRTTGITRPLLLHPGDVCSLALSPDGRLGVSADQFGNLAVWFVETGERIGTLTQPTPSSPHAAPVRPALVFSPDNTHFRALRESARNGLELRQWALVP